MTVRDEAAQLLRRRIESDEFRPNMPIPSERELSSQLGVSRMTVRAAIEKLVDEGLLVRRQGRRTLVSSEKIMHGSTFTSFSDEMRAKGWIPRSKVLSFVKSDASMSVSARLGVSPGSSVIYLERLRFADDTPLALERAYLPYQPYSRLLTMDLESTSLYELLEQEFGTRPTRSDESIEAVLMTPEEALLFELPPASPALLTRRTTSDARGIAVEVVSTLYRGDRYRMALTRHR